MSFESLNSQAIPLVDPNARDPNHDLWVAVLGKAVHDAFFTTGKQMEDYYETDLALNWLDGNSTDFKIVCHLAGRDFSYVKKKLESKIEVRKNFFKKIKEGMWLSLANKEYKEEMKNVYKAFKTQSDLPTV